MKRLTALLLGISATVILGIGVDFAEDSLMPGDAWLKWNEDARTAYVSGYVWGYDRGFHDACAVAEKMWVKKRVGLPGHECVAKIASVPMAPEQYATAMTDYFRAYPEDRGIELRRVIEGLTTRPKMTVEQMHEYFGPTAKH